MQDARQDANTGEPLVYKHSSIISKIREDLMSSNFSSIWLECGLPNKKKFLVCNLYREWQLLGQGADKSSKSIQQQLARWVIFIEQFERALSSGMEVYCMGDTNLDFLTWTNSDLSCDHKSVKLKQLIRELFDRILAKGVVQCVKSPTRSWPGQPDSGLDHFYTNTPNKISPVQACVEGASDHKLINAVRFSSQLKCNARYVQKRSYKNFDKHQFLEEFRHLSWWDVYCCSEVDRANELFTDKLTCILDKYAPVKKFQSRKNYVAWLSKETKYLMKKRDEAQKLAVATQSLEDWSNYKSIRNAVTKRIKDEKYNWQKNKVELCSNDSGKLWSHIKGWLNISNVSSPTQLYHEGSVETSPRIMARIMNEFYIEKVRKIRENLAPSQINPLYKLEQLRANSNSVFSLKPVHPDFVMKIIGSLPCSKATGLDDIDTFVLKLVKEMITPAVTHLINLSIQNSTFPNKWKHAKVIPLFKPGSDDKLAPKSYRPVALLPVLSKVLERVVFAQIVQYMNDHDLFHPNHHGFRSKHSTLTAMLQMYDTWMEAINRGEYAGVVMIDQSAAFDCVDHDLLISKLKLYGWDEAALIWTKHYLSNRTQCCSIESFLSDPLSISVGVPQGSILGPLFYCIFTNDFPEVVHQPNCSAQLHMNNNSVIFNLHCIECGGVTVYADDSTYSASANDSEVLSGKLEAKFQMMADYLTSNRLKVNSDKTHLLVLSTEQKQRRQSVEVSMNAGNSVIVSSQHERLLGVHIQQNMKWTEYIRDNRNSLLYGL